MAFILGKKLKMTQIWKEGKVVPVTVVEAQPNRVALVRSKTKEGYEAVQVAQGKAKREFRAREWHPIDTAQFKAGDEVNVQTNDDLKAAYIRAESEDITSGLTPEFKSWLDDIEKNESDIIKLLAKA